MNQDFFDHIYPLLKLSPTQKEDGTVFVPLITYRDKVIAQDYTFTNAEQLITYLNQVYEVIQKVEWRRAFSHV